MSRMDPVREAQAVASLRASLAAVDADDEALLLDTIEGETGLFEVIDAIIGRMVENRVMIAGLESVISDLETRKARYDQRIKADRTLIEQAMMIADLPKIERPAATLSLANRPPKALVEEESSIPPQFWKTGAPTLDKAALLAALKDGETIPGARLDNAAPSLTARFK